MTTTETLAPVTEADKAVAYAFCQTGYMKGSGGIPILYQMIAAHRIASIEANSQLSAENKMLRDALRWLRAWWMPGSDHDTNEVQLGLAAADAALAAMSHGELVHQHNWLAIGGGRFRCSSCGSEEGITRS